jgi:hypothetical protein
MPTTSTPSRFGADGGGADDAVDAGGGSAPDEDGESLTLAHLILHAISLRFMDGWGEGGMVSTSGRRIVVFMFRLRRKSIG